VPAFDVVVNVLATCRSASSPSSPVSAPARRRGLAFRRRVRDPGELPLESLQLYLPTRTSSNL